MSSAHPTLIQHAHLQSNVPNSLNCENQNEDAVKASMIRRRGSQHSWHQSVLMFPTAYDTIGSENNTHDPSRGLTLSQLFALLYAMLIPLKIKFGRLNYSSVFRIIPTSSVYQTKLSVRQTELSAFVAELP